ncbi:MAG: WD40 repeat domain-containing protein, partial [Promethearchaeota archaeon]
MLEKKIKESFEYPQHLYPKRKGLAKAFHMSKSFGHSRDVTSVALSHKGDYIVSGSKDNTLKIWDFLTGNLLRTIEAHDHSILAVAVSMDDNYIYSSSSDNLIKVWGLKRGHFINELREHTDSVTSLAITSDGKNIISGSKDK